MHPRNDQVLANVPYFCLTPVYHAIPLPPCAFSYSEGNLISPQSALSPIAWVLTPSGSSGDTYLFPFLFPASPSLREGHFRACCSYRNFTWYLPIEGESIWVVHREEEGPSWDFGVCSIGLVAGSEDKDGRRKLLCVSKKPPCGAGRGSRGTPEASGTSCSCRGSCWLEMRFLKIQTGLDCMSGTWL